MIVGAQGAVRHTVTPGFARAHAAGVAPATSPPCSSDRQHRRACEVWATEAQANLSRAVGTGVQHRPKAVILFRGPAWQGMLSRTDMAIPGLHENTSTTVVRTSQCSSAQLV